MDQVQAVAPRWSPADSVTLTRAVLTVPVLLLAITALDTHVDPWVPVVLGSVALSLDFIDGRVARRTHTESARGARFDMEADAALLVALSLLVAPKLGWWVLAIGAARYGFWLAQVLVPRLRRPAPPRGWCKVVAAVQGVALLVAAAPLLPSWVDRVLVGVALVLLTESFVHEGADRWTGRSVSVVRPALTLAAAALVWAAMLAPASMAQVDLTQWLRLPVEVLLLAALALALPRRPARVLSAGAGLVIALAACLCLADLGFRQAFDRPFHPAYDYVYATDGVGVLEDSIGVWPGRLVTALVLILLLAIVLAVPLAAARLVDRWRRHRTTGLRAVGVLTAVWTLLAVAGSGLASSQVVSRTVDEITQFRQDVADGRAFSAALGSDPVAAQDPAFTLLKDHDVLVVFVESYGRTAVGTPTVTRALARGERRLTRTGWQTRSAWLTSPTFGGISWLAHSTLESGLWVDNAHRYDELMASHRATLASMMGRAGWRTADFVPSDSSDWPAGRAFYGWDRIYGGSDLGYAGPRFSYAAMPDQYILSAVQRLELSRPGDLMAEVDLVSSHVPWAPLPHMVPWRSLGDGSVFAPMAAAGPRVGELWQHPDQVRLAYLRSVGYSMHAITSFLARSTDPHLVVLVLGDHQPATVAQLGVPSGQQVSHDVPATLLTRDPAVMARTSAWGWTPGLAPSTTSPVWPMDAFRNRFVTAYR